MDNEIRIKVARHLAKLAEEIGEAEKRLVSEHVNLVQMVSGENNITFNYVTSVDRVTEYMATLRAKMDGFLEVVNVATICGAITFDQAVELQELRYHEMGRYTVNGRLLLNEPERVLHYPIRRDQAEAVEALPKALKAMVLDILYAASEVKTIETAEHETRVANAMRVALFEKYNRKSRSMMAERVKFLEANSVKVIDVFPGQDVVPIKELAKLCVEVELERRLQAVDSLKPVYAAEAIQRFMGVTPPLADDVVARLR